MTSPSKWALDSVGGDVGIRVGVEGSMSCK